MKILFLIITITWSFSGGYQNTPSYVVINSAEQAAIYIYNNKPKSCEVEPDQKKYNLFLVDFETKKIEEVKIPKVFFKGE